MPPGPHARRLGSKAGCKALVAAAAGFLIVLSAPPAMAETLDIAVEAIGSVPGISDSSLPVYLAQEMNAAGNGSWHFAPMAAGATPPPNRVEWSFKTLSSAIGSVRNYGFSRAAFDRLLDRRHYLSVEATLYLNGQYQTQSLFEVTTMGRHADSDLAPEITQGTQQLMTYVAMDTGAEAPVSRHKQPAS